MKSNNDNEIHNQIQYRNIIMEKARMQIVEDEAIIATEVERRLQSFLNF
ncbi:MAG: hypothetical protein HOD92_14085 [Deltaproteobacteria bacterium]|nr:hypothetical protein [Deltaproteobacteria bacterium]